MLLALFTFAFSALAFRFCFHYANSVTHNVDEVTAASLIYAILSPAFTLKILTELFGIIILVVIEAVGAVPNATWQ
jgi:hypothetical protein